MSEIVAVSRWRGYLVLNNVRQADWPRARASSCWV